MHRLDSTKNPRRSALSAAILFALAVSTISCATSSPPPLPVVSPQIRIPSPPVVSEPMPLGAYWARHCELLRLVQSTLKISPPEIERCKPDGPR